MRVRFWGVRGAIAATQPDCQGTGGNTPCVEVRDSEGELIVLDAGMGLYWLGRSLLAGPHGRGQGSAALLLSHTHWDHIQGIPFFVPMFIPGNKVDIYGGGVEHLENVLEGQMNPDYSPIVSLSNFGGTVKIADLQTHDQLEIGTLKITTQTYANGPHQIVGFRMEEATGGGALCYVPEVHYRDGVLNPDVIELARGAKALIHEAFYTNEELAQGGTSLAGPLAPKADGHSCFSQAVDLALAAEVEKLYFFYHHPDHNDATLEASLEAERERVKAKGATLELDLAREGREFSL